MLTFLGETLSGLWFFALGSCIGSFLNVVVYRVPAGRSLLGSSCCPFCATAIQWYDNIPVFGWWLIGGRCRTCRARIASRYPLVEFLVGSVFLSLSISDVALGLVNWPGMARPYYQGFTWHLFSPNPTYLFVFASHAVLMVLLLGAALIRMDGNPVPDGITRCMLLGLVIVIIGDPGLPNGSEPRLDQLFGTVDELKADGPRDWASLQIRAAGFLYAALFGLILRWAYTSPASDTPSSNVPAGEPRGADTFNSVFVWGMLGTWLGIFAMTCITAFAAVLCRLSDALDDPDPEKPSREDQVSLGRELFDGFQRLGNGLMRQPLGLLFLSTWIYLLGAGVFSSSQIFPGGWDRTFWIGVFTAMAFAVFYRHRVVRYAEFHV